MSAGCNSTNSTWPFTHTVPMCASERNSQAAMSAWISENVCLYAGCCTNTSYHFRSSATQSLGSAAGCGPQHVPRQHSSSSRQHEHPGSHHLLAVLWPMLEHDRGCCRAHGQACRCKLLKCLPQSECLRQHHEVFNKQFTHLNSVSCWSTRQE